MINFEYFPKSSYNTIHICLLPLLFICIANKISKALELNLLIS